MARSQEVAQNLVAVPSQGAAQNQEVVPSQGAAQNQEVAQNREVLVDHEKVALVSEKYLH